MKDHKEAAALVVLFLEDPKFFKAPATASYKDRNPASETPSHVDWDAYFCALENLLSLHSAKNFGNDRNTDSDDSSCPKKKACGGDCGTLSSVA
jgi:hypothetical protein